MATDFIVELVLAGHDVFLLEDEETYGEGAGPGNGEGDGFGDNGDEDLMEIIAVNGWTGDGDGSGDGVGEGWGDGWGDNEDADAKDEYGYRLPS